MYWKADAFLIQPIKSEGTTMAKAKDWYSKMTSATSEEEFTTVLGNCLKALVDDARNLIKVRKAKSDKAVAACINEVNNKWLAIVALHEKASYGDDHHMYGVKLAKDGFKAAFVHENPSKGWYFDLKAHKQNMEVLEKQEVDKMITGPTYKLFGLTPFEELTPEALPKEILENLYLIGRCHSDPSIPMGLLAPLVHRARLLRYWSSKGCINLEEAEAMVKDPYEFFEKNNIPI